MIHTLSPIFGAEPLSEKVRGGAISIGNFDGVHRGHAVLIESLCQQAKLVGGPAVVVTFDPHPAAILRPDSMPVRLTTIERRAELLSQLGVDHVVVCKTDAALLGLEATAFFEQLIVGKLLARAMVEGPNFYFGKDRQGTPDRLAELCRQHDVGLQLVQAETAEAAGQIPMISSTRVRQLIEAGAIADANDLLTERYRIAGIVSAGDQRGRQLGFPTANVEAIPTLVPAPGVYASRTWVDEQPFASATHIGPNPTFTTQAKQKVESHLLDYAEDLYGSRVQIEFVERVRDVRKFESVEQLVEQMHRDIAAVRRCVRYP